MKKILSLAVLLSGISFTTIAQEAPKTEKSDVKKEVRGDRNGGHKKSGKKDKVQQTPEEFAKSRTERLDKKVKLSDKQRTEVEAMYLAKAKAGKPASKEEGVKRREASKEELKKILTPEQQKLMSDKMTKKEVGKGKKKDGDRKNEKKGERPSSKKSKSPMPNTSNS